MELIEKFYEILEEYTSLKLETIETVGDSIYIKDNLEKKKIEWKVYNLDRFVFFKIEECGRHDIFLEKGLNKILEIYKNSFENIKKEAWISEVGKIYYIKEELERIDISLKKIANEAKDNIKSIEIFEKKEFKVRDFIKEGDITIIRWGRGEIKLKEYKKAILNVELLLNSDKNFSVIILKNMWKEGGYRGIEIKGDRDKIEIFSIKYKEDIENIEYEKRTPK